MWSLAVEEQFYLIWPFVVLYFRDKIVPLCLSLLVIFAILRVVLLMNGMEASAIYTMTITHLDALLIGSALAVASKENRY